MKTLVIYYSRFGAAEKCAHSLASAIGNDCRAVPIGRIKPEDWKNAREIILGSSIHIGKIGRPLRQFIRSHTGELQVKKLGLFLCSGDQEKDYFGSNYPSEILSSSRVTMNFGGELDLQKVSPLLRFLLKKRGVTASYSRLSQEGMDQFVRLWKKDL